MSRLTITENHIKLLERSYFSFIDGPYYGHVEQNAKLPYGNADVVADLYETLEGEEWDWDEHEEMPEDLEEGLLKVHREMADVMGILCQSAAKGFEFRAGRTYYQKSLYDATSWEPIP